MRSILTRPSPPGIVKRRAFAGGATLQTRAGHALAEAALFEEVVFEVAELLVEQVVGLVNQAEATLAMTSGCVLGSVPL